MTVSIFFKSEYLDSKRNNVFCGDIYNVSSYKIEDEICFLFKGETMIAGIPTTQNEILGLERLEDRRNNNVNK